jgi:hypothetical protein
MTATLIQNPSSGVLLKNISWHTYESLVNELAEQPGIRLTYDRNKLEIMSPWGRAGLCNLSASFKAVGEPAPTAY